MSDTQHTPTPWRIETKEGLVLRIVGANDYPIGTVCVHLAIGDDDEANAKLIERAVNCHNDLLAACENLVETIRNGTVYLVGKPQLYNGSIVRLFRDVENASSAITKAKRESQ